MTELVPTQPSVPAARDDVVLPGTADRALSGVPAAKAPLLTRAQLHAMVEACDPETLAGKRDRLLLVVLRALGGRPGDAADLYWANVQWWTWEQSTTGARIVPGPAGDIWLNDTLTVRHIPEGEFTDHAPFDLLEDWRDGLAAADPTYEDGPLFRAITKNDRVRIRGMTPPAIRAVVKRAAERAGLPDPGRYSAASLARR